MKEVQRVGIVGCGLMGSGIAANVVQHGLEVVLYDAAPAAVERAQAVIARHLRRRQEKGELSAAEVAEAEGRVRTAQGLAEMAEVDLVIEAVFEDFALKASLFEELSAGLPEDRLVATNTSCLRVSDLQRHLRGPERFLGLHYFSPAQVNPVVELVRGERTAAWALELAERFLTQTGKTVIRCRDSHGFAINRFFCPYTNQAARALDAGLGAAGDIDAVACAILDAPAGPFAVMNLIKPRINLQAVRNLAPLGAFYAPASALVAHGEADRPFALESSGPLTPERRQQIADHLLAGCFLPVLQALDEEVADPAAIDLGARLALRFGRPPCALMDELGKAEVERILRPWLERFELPMPASFHRIGRLAGSRSQHP